MKFRPSLNVFRFTYDNYELCALKLFVSFRQTSSQKRETNYVLFFVQFLNTLVSETLKSKRDIPLFITVEQYKRSQYYG